MVGSGLASDSAGLESARFVLTALGCVLVLLRR
jgi:hypothetical protein